MDSDTLYVEDGVKCCMLQQLDFDRDVSYDALTVLIFRNTDCTRIDIDCPFRFARQYFLYADRVEVVDEDEISNERIEDIYHKDGRITSNAKASNGGLSFSKSWDIDLATEMFDKCDAAILAAECGLHRSDGCVTRPASVCRPAA